MLLFVLMNLCSLNKKLLYMLIKRYEEVICEKVQLCKKTPQQGSNFTQTFTG